MSGHKISSNSHQHKCHIDKQPVLKIVTVSYGSAIIIISAIIQYLAQPGIENCNSMAGIVSTYTSKDYSLGCQLLSNMHTGTIVAEIIGIAIVVFGVFSKPKIK